MSTIDKLIKRFSNKPNDFKFSELKRMLNHLGYVQTEGTGSRVVFANQVTGHKIKLHKPHPGDILKRYQIETIKDELKTKKLL